VPEGECTCEDCLADFETIRDDFASLDDWEDRYRYVIELGHTLEPLSEAAHNESNKVRGCVSQVWLQREARTSADGQAILHYRGDSDSHLVRGLIAISISLFSDRGAKADSRRRRPGRLSCAGPGAASYAAALERRARHDRAHARGRRCSLSSASIRVSDRQNRRDFPGSRHGGLVGVKQESAKPAQTAKGLEPVAKALSVELTRSARVPG
jgi:sulfur transfer protein SufE